ncbi:MAG: hypothetical protein ABJN22_03335 [Litorimonas sp.]
MRFSTNTELTDITAALMACTLPKPKWTHAAHFTAAIVMLSNPDADPFSSLPDIIRNYNLATGVQNTDTEGYHHTITLASLLAARHVLETSPISMRIFEIANKLLDSEYGSSDWILKYWTKPVLFSPKARRVWVAPDIEPLPFSLSEAFRPKTQ